jgi:hypothetical protein
LVVLDPRSILSHAAPALDAMEQRGHGRLANPRGRPDRPIDSGQRRCRGDLTARSGTPDKPAHGGLCRD